MMAKSGAVPIRSMADTFYGAPISTHSQTSCMFSSKAFRYSLTTAAVYFPAVACKARGLTSHDRYCFGNRTPTSNRRSSLVTDRELESSVEEIEHCEQLTHKAEEGGSTLSNPRAAPHRPNAPETWRRGGGIFPPSRLRKSAGVEGFVVLPGTG